ncbi:MAG: adenylate/guanylate cyclase domain-containing protein [Burkholderiales bacterium]|nr:adenylate/guanylate cyclase domain-containing protein [Burkholderiales bacterium]
MQQAVNRTTICSVVFLDIVEYSKRSVAEQIKLKNQFNALISVAIRNVHLTDRIILDTGDGAAISFLGDPEDALLTAMKLRDAVIGEKDMPFYVRIGINLGPVRLVQDINKQPNIIGDGINVAQRVMNFAQPNQILVSRSFYDVISCVTDEYAKLFEYEGSRTDKHVREHEIYAVKSEARQDDAMKASFKHADSSVAPEPERAWWNDRNILVRRVFPATTILAILVALIVKMTGQEAPREITAPPPSAGKTEPARIAAQPASAPLALSQESAPVPVAKAPEPVKKASKPVHEARKKENAEKTQPVENSTLVFRIMPWGEVYVDGSKRGVSPPLKSIRIKPGHHEIEVRNTTLPSHSQTVETKPGEQVIINHTF